MNDCILPGETIGIIGGGQLGRMMAIAAKQMGYNIAVLDPTPNSPCGQVADIEIVGNFDDIDAIKKLAHHSDVVTYEFENIDYDALIWLEQNARLPQGSRLLATTQDRSTEKATIVEAGVGVAPYILVDSEKKLIDALNQLEYPCVLKTCRGGYDGKGQAVIRKDEDISKALPLLDHGPCVLEAWISFEKEISVIVSRSMAGEVKAFPVAENIHVDNILHQSVVPARTTDKIVNEAHQIAINLAETLQMVGTLAVEMFVTKEGKIFINELAPRPHNSGHYTMEACKTSQFEQHIRAICNLPLGETDLLTPVVMMNILGEHVEAVMNNITKFTTCKLHLYGKKEAKVKRKMGHINILADNNEEAIKQANKLNIWPEENDK
ncbi:5-(carboxyamino)imidazole ribonucleotide synthase [Cytobacillus sp. IB215665]|uniref:5-(carboxyamino)imidazole ribonucleotide synthase n=1 Tax=Cytobacillus sp. IB215665 TaxID=3097357 RepID=UPI002A0FEE48|nr:5-(carboxyamino)imidazole ribonucleotide synthase [Cytobacillus sp. IB215665]MDX8365169.1 5-(carboxyamino)imidazole ribonucleotide synthase [Cytobacillus sp. IB215665]